jgi:hypothetical protein
MSTFTLTEAGTIYGKWLLPHVALIQEIASNMNNSFKAEHHQVYDRYLQSDEVADAGLFLFSHWNLDIDRLTEVLSTISVLHISGRWKAIYKGRQWTPGAPQPVEQKTPPLRAMHIESTRKDKSKVMTLLRGYNTSQKR